MTEIPDEMDERDLLTLAKFEGLNDQAEAVIKTRGMMFKAKAELEVALESYSRARQYLEGDLKLVQELRAQFIATYKEKDVPD